MFCDTYMVKLPKHSNITHTHVSSQSYYLIRYLTLRKPARLWICTQQKQSLSHVMLQKNTGFYTQGELENK